MLEIVVFTLALALFMDAPRKDSREGAEIAYRMAKDLTLPLHWSYEDIGPDAATGIDRRSPGAQVWTSLVDIALASCDLSTWGGFYGPAIGYRYVLTVQAKRMEEGDPWSAVTPDGVTGLWAMPSSKLAAWIRQQVDDAAHGEAFAFLPPQTGTPIEEWAGKNQDKIREYLRKESFPVPIRWVETLPSPNSPSPTAAPPG